MRLAAISAQAVIAVCFVAALAVNSSRADEPIWKGDELIFPEGAAIPRYMTETERRFLETHPLASNTRAVTPAPTGPVRCVAEYEPMDGIVITWRSYPTIQSPMGAQITTTGNADLYVIVQNSTTQNSATASLTSAGANMSRVKFFTYPSDTVWVRDYGPRYIYQGNCRALVDHTYNRPRPNDDVVPGGFASYKHHAFYEHQLVHGGGNYHLDANSRGFATELIWNENPGLSQETIHDIWQNYLNVDTHIFPPFPRCIDLTQHLDMWMQIVANDKVVISDWPNNAGSTQDVICDDAATYMAGQGYTVYRVPAFALNTTCPNTNASQVHYTYTNVVMCNNLVLLPSYTNPTVSPSNATALATWQSALPGKTIVQVNCQGMISAAGAMHCIVSHVPMHLGAVGPNGGLAPTAYLKNLRGGDVLTPGVNTAIQWITDDDVRVNDVDIRLSTNSGGSYDTIIASATADDGTHTWSVPNVYTTHARMRIVARDGVGNTGFDASPADFTINGAALPGDVNCDTRVTLADVDPFVQALVNASAFTSCNLNAADMNADTQVNAADVTGFIQALGL